MRELFYDCEIIKLISPEPGYMHCGGWDDFDNMGISVIGACHSEFGVKAFLAEEFDVFLDWIHQSDRIIGFNSMAFDDFLCQANGIDISTTYDLLVEVRVATGQPPGYVKGQTRAGYSLGALANANLDCGKSGSGELAPKLWQDGRKEAVVSYCLNDVYLLRDLYEQRKNLKDPNDGTKIICRD